MTWDPNPGARDSISVAIISPGNRLKKITKPFETTNLTYRTEPDNPYEFDILLIDMVNARMGIESLKKWMHDAKLVYRMRGDIYREVDMFDTNRIKDWLGMNVALPRVDGVVSVAPYMARKAKRKSGIKPADSVSIPLDHEAWPNTEHHEDALRLITLTNANYWPKVRPILEWAREVEPWLERNSGKWVIGAQGKHSERLKIALEDYNKIEFKGYIDAQDWMVWGNVTLHPSNLDGHPNAMLEGMASRMPVVTTDFISFEEYPGPLQTVADEEELWKTLTELKDPRHRQNLGEMGLGYVMRNHSAEEIGKQYVEYFKDLLNYE